MSAYHTPKWSESPKYYKYSNWARRRVGFICGALLLIGVTLSLYKYHNTGRISPPMVMDTPWEVQTARNTPLARQCGTWQKDYTELHRKIMAGEAPQRFVTWRCDPKTSIFKTETAWCGGLRDRMFGMMTAFIYALINDRAFLMDSKFPVPWEDLMDSPNDVKWQYTKEVESYIKSLNSSEVFYQIGEAIHMFDHHEANKDSQNIIAQGDRWVGHSFIRDDPRAARVRQMGLPVEGGFACLIDYLFTPAQPVAKKMQPYVNALDERNSLSVGVNIRYPDTFVVGPDAKDEGSLADAQKILQCAHDVHKMWEPWTRPVDARYTPRPLVIYLLTNSLNLRKEAMAAYPSVVVASQWEVKHIDSMNTTYETAWPSVAENWIFSETRFKLIRENSRGFARLAAARSWWKYHHMIPWVKEDTDCFAGDLFSREEYWWVEW